MKKLYLAVAVAGLTMASGVSQAQEGVIQSDLDASLRLGLELDTEPDAELVFDNFSSRIRWNASAGLTDELQAIGYIELGFDQDEGVNNTRHAWLGVESGFGSIKGGKQYTAFYDAVTSVVDIAFFNSCFNEISCLRQSSVIKFTGPADDDIQFLASTTLVEDDLGNDFIDGIEVAAVTTRNDIRFGVGANILFGTDLTAVVVDAAGNPIEDANGDIQTLTVESDTGVGLGISAQKRMGDATASATIQFANSDFLGTDDNGLLFTGTYGVGNMYALFSIADADNTPYYFTYGYVYDLVPDKALIYFEAGVEEEDIDGQDANLFGRAVMILDFDVLSSTIEGI